MDLSVSLSPSCFPSLPLSYLPFHVSSASPRSALTSFIPRSPLTTFTPIILHTYAYSCVVIMIIADTWDCRNYYRCTVAELAFCSITFDRRYMGAYISLAIHLEPCQAPLLSHIEATCLPCVIALLAICDVFNDLTERKMASDLYFRSSSIQNGWWQRREDRDGEVISVQRKTDMLLELVKGADVRNRKVKTK